MALLWRQQTQEQVWQQAAMAITFQPAAAVCKATCNAHIMFFPFPTRISQINIIPAQLHAYSRELAAVVLLKQFSFSRETGYNYIKLK